MSELGRKLARALNAQDNLRSMALAAAMMGLSGIVSYVLLGIWGVVIAATLVAISSAVTASGELLLRVQRARRIAPYEAPELARMLHHLASRAGIAPPHLYLLPSALPNALATETSDGRGAMAMTRGLLSRLNHEELEGVMAHELSHLKNGDTRLTRWTSSATQSATTLLRVSVWMGLISTLFTGQGLGTWLLLLLLSWVVPVLFGLLQSALSRTREFAADTNAVELTGRPLALASALAKLEGASTPWLRLLFRAPRTPGWLDSHPATADRIARLRALGRGGPDSYRSNPRPPNGPVVYRVYRTWP